MAEPSPSYCALAWTHLATSSDGSLRLCCLARQMPGSGLRDQSLLAGWNSAGFKEARERMLKGQSVPACETCHIEEKGGKKSHRILNNERQAAQISQRILEPQLQSLDLRLGNTCNLQCVMCRPQESTKWNALAQTLSVRAQDVELKNSMHSNLREAVGVSSWLKRENWLEDFAKVLPTLKEIILGGGEPLLSERHLQLLSACVDSGHSQHIALRYHTNGTILDAGLFEMWQKFSLVEVYVSVDGVGERNRYIRYPAQWETLENNLHLLDQHGSGKFKYRILKSVQALNFLYLPEFAQWIESQNFKNLRYDGWFLPNIVHEPKYLSVQIYPEKLKKFVSELLRDFERTSTRPTPQLESVIQFMNQKDESNRLPQFREYIQLLDEERGTNFRQTFPELAEAIL